MEYSVPIDYVSNMTIEQHVNHMGWHGREIGFRLAIDLMKSRVKHEETTVEVPRTWWDHLKLTLLTSLPNWVPAKYSLRVYGKLLKYKRSLVKYRNIGTNITTHYHMCPSSGRNSYYSFLGWKTPFEGSHEEYVALKKIAEAGLEGSHDRYMPNFKLLDALQQYKRLQTQ